MRRCRRGLLGSLAAALRRASRRPKGEITIVVGPPQEAEPDLRESRRRCSTQALPFMPVRAAADLIAEALDLPKRAVYERALAMKTRMMNA